MIRLFRTSTFVLLVALILPTVAAAKTPLWLKQAARIALPEYDKDINAVQLLDEQITTVDNKGRVITRYRRAFKILRPEGSARARAVVYFDKETDLTYLRAWTIPAQGKDYEVKEKDAVTLGLSDGSLYQDTRYKVLTIPGAVPGAVVGYEYEQKGRPFVLQSRWLYQDTIPVRVARYILTLPPGWEFEAVWMNAAELDATLAGENTWRWELENIEPVKLQRSMPPWRAVAGWMAVTFFPTTELLSTKSHRSWEDVGAWYSRLAAGRRDSTPDLLIQVDKLTEGATTTIEKIRALAAYAQREVRYVAIEIGIGGYQPHSAKDVFSNGYGDCKDKATVLSTMLSAIGLDSYYVLIHSDRGVVAPQFPSMLNFNHVILAIQLPDDVITTNLYAIQEHETLGRLLYFDPTSTLTSLGYLPSYLQASHGLLVTERGGELLRMPILPPVTNRLLRRADLKLSEEGTLSGDVEEVRWGAPAFSRRSAFLNRTDLDKSKVIENFLSGFLGGFQMTSGKVMNLEQYDENLVLQFSFVAPKFAKKVGSLMLLRPRVVGQKGDDILEDDEDRVHPVGFDYPTLQTDRFTIELPAGFIVDELPPPVDVDFGFASYSSKVEIEGNSLVYVRTYEVRDVLIGMDNLDQLKKFYRRVASDERASAVLKRGQP